VPQLRPPSEDAPELLELDCDHERVTTERHAWGQAWFPDLVTAENRDDVQAKMALWESHERAPRWQPVKRPSMCMSAAAARHINMWSDNRIGLDMLEIPGTKDRRSDDVAPRFRTINKIVATGDRLWASLGAWPWTAFEDGHPPAEWWTRPEPLTTLQQAVDAHVAAIRESMARGEALSDHLRGLS